MNIGDMDSSEFFNEFSSDLWNFQIDCEILTKMLVHGIDAELEAFKRTCGDSEDCLTFKWEIYKYLEAYSKTIECHCLKLKSNYEKAFDRVDPGKSRNIMSLEEY